MLNLHLIKAISLLVCSLLITIFINSCSQETTSASIPNEIVLIFQEPKVQWQKDQTSGRFKISKCELTYWDDDQLQRKIHPDSSKMFDTIVVQTTQRQVEFAHLFRRMDQFEYLFRNGDTVLFTYQDHIPYATVLNRADSSYLVNYAWEWRKKLGDHGRPAKKRNALLEYINIPAQIRGEKFDKDAIDSIGYEIQIAVKQEFEEELNHLDSLRSYELISQDQYNFRRNNALFAWKRDDLVRNRNVFSRFRTEDPLTIQDMQIDYEQNGEARFDFENIMGSEYDSLLSFRAYRELAKCYQAYYGRKVKWITTTHMHNGQPGGKMTNPDYTKRYDSIQSSPFLSDQVKKHLLLLEVEKIMEWSSIDAKESFLRRYEAEYADSAAMKYLHDTYALGLIDTTKQGPDLQLVDQQGKVILYQKLLAQHKGKIIYVDFWSSGCRPCIGEMPHAETLEAEYQEKEIAFLYISLDADQDRWTQACAQFKRDRGSYLIHNKFTSRELEELKVDWIPHYMIYDREGKRVVDYAPRPSEKELRPMLDKYLIEDKSSISGAMP